MQLACVVEALADSSTLGLCTVKQSLMNRFAPGVLPTAQPMSATAPISLTLLASAATVYQTRFHCSYRKRSPTALRASLGGSKSSGLDSAMMRRRTLDPPGTLS